MYNHINRDYNIILAYCSGRSYDKQTVGRYVRPLNGRIKKQKQKKTHESSTNIFIIYTQEMPCEYQIQSQKNLNFECGRSGDVPFTSAIGLVGWLVS